MATEKITSTVDDEIRIRDGLAAMREYELDEGPFTEEEIAEAHAILAKADAAARANAPGRPDPLPRRR